LDRFSVCRYSGVVVDGSWKGLDLPTILRKYGYRFHFYSNERDEPPHVHVTGKGGEMKVWLPALVIDFSYGLSPPEQRRVISVVSDNVDMFMEKWNEFASKKG